MHKNVVLLILDGFGLGRKDNSNPIYAANPATLNFLKKNYRYGALEASGIAVGLPWNEEGNSEVGHITLGAGKVVYQHYPRITLAIQNGSFFKNEVLRKNFGYLPAGRQAPISKDKAVHLIGALTSGHVHASLDHLKALIEFAKQENVKKLYLHLITDGRDGAPQAAVELIKEVESAIKEAGVGKIATIGGRYYGMDRDEHYDRTLKFYTAIFGRGKTADEAITWLKKNYSEGLNDEYIEPVTLAGGKPPQDNDSIIFFNFREDSAKQLAEPFALVNFSQFETIPLKDMKLASFTNYSNRLKIPVAFPGEGVAMPLGLALAEHGKIQLRIAETEKYAHVTYFFNGLKEEHFANEYRVLIPSENIARHDEHPEMRAREIASRVISAVGEGGSDFILANLANPDVIAHTGNFEAGVKAVQVIDEEVKRVYDACLASGATLVITSDHGNLEQMRNPLTGEIESKHNTSPVPIYIIGREFVSIKSAEQAERSEREIAGILSDVAPTILEIMGLPIPQDMTGVSLLGSLR